MDTQVTVGLVTDEEILELLELEWSQGKLAALKKMILFVLREV